MEHERVSEDHTDDSVYSDADLTSHLREKIRLQASRLRNLEQYRLLCEKRIQDLQPGHTLPIKKEHIGQASLLNHELDLAKEKISRLEAQVSQQTLESDEGRDSSDYLLLLEKYNDLLKDKNDLEESLRAEMLNCEEQRTYIELLKQTIEGKMEELDGMSLDPKSLSMLNSSRSRGDDNRREQSRMKNAILDYESQIKRLQHQMKNKDKENEMLVKEREELDSHLRQAAEALQVAEEEVTKLEEEKTSLVEYVEQHASKEREMERELNDLSRYFEEMKNDFHETLTSLEAFKSNTGKLETECELYKQELYKSAQLNIELESSVEDSKKSLIDKDSTLKEIKEQKANAEIKIERLQANIISLTNLLKEAQSENLKHQTQIDDFTKSDSQRSESINKLKGEQTGLYQENMMLKEKLAMLQKELETEKKGKMELERIREFDIKQLQEFKGKIMDLQAKCDILEGLKRNRSESDSARKNDVVRISQLEEEVTYLQETLRELQQQESLYNQTVNESKLVNTKLRKQIEELYLENETIRIDLNKKSKDYELYHSKFSHLNEYCETLENDKSEYEELYKIEKNNLKLLKDQILDDKFKQEELQKNINDLNKICETLENKFKEKDAECRNLKQQTKSIERELKDSSQSHTKSSSIIKALKTSVEVKETELDDLTTEINNICKVISAFCGKFPTYGERPSFSLKYHEFLNTWKSDTGSNINSLNVWVANTIEEVQELARSLLQSNKQLKIATSELSKFQSKFDEVNSGETIYKEHALKLKSELDEIYQKHELMLEKSEEEIHSLRYEVNSLKHEVVSLSTEKFSLTEALKSAINENQGLKMTNEFTKKSQRGIDLTEKKLYSKEAMMKQVQRDLGSELRQLEDELNDSESEKIRKSIICSQNHSPETCPLLHLKPSEKSAKPRLKSQFS